MSKRNNSRQGRKKQKLNKRGKLFFAGLLLVLLLLIFFLFKQNHEPKPSQTATSSSLSTKKTTKSSAVKPAASSSQSSSEKPSANNLPNLKQSDWQMILVNRDNKKDELNPDLTTIGNIQIDARIADKAQEFLAAAQQINPLEHLISGYRSVDYQTKLYQQYVDLEMTGGAGAVNTTGQPISEAQAEKNVQTYSQPPGASEHQTGLAMDMSSIDSLNAQDPAITEKIAALAPTYGFVLRFPVWGSATTGVGDEDWHYRYVGVEAAKYMTEHQLTLEQFVKQLPK